MCTYEMQMNVPNPYRKKTLTFEEWQEILVMYYAGKLSVKETTIIFNKLVNASKPVLDLPPCIIAAFHAWQKNYLTFDRANQQVNLVDINRKRVWLALLHGCHTTEEIEKKIRLNGTSIRQHLHEFITSNLVKKERISKKFFYSIQQKGLAA